MLKSVTSANLTWIEMNPGEYIIMQGDHKHGRELYDGDDSH